MKHKRGDPDIALGHVIRRNLKPKKNDFGTRSTRSYKHSDYVDILAVEKHLSKIVHGKIPSGEKPVDLEPEESARIRTDDSSNENTSECSNLSSPAEQADTVKEESTVTRDPLYKFLERKGLNKVDIFNRTSLIEKPLNSLNDSECHNEMAKLQTLKSESRYEKCLRCHKMFGASKMANHGCHPQRCEICHSLLKDRAAYNLHMEIHKKARISSRLQETRACETCDHVLPKKEYSKHVLSCGKKKIRKCASCKKMYFSKLERDACGKCLKEQVENGIKNTDDSSSSETVDIESVTEKDAASKEKRTKENSVENDYIGRRKRKGIFPAVDNAKVSKESTAENDVLTENMNGTCLSTSANLNDADARKVMSPDNTKTVKATKNPKVQSKKNKKKEKALGLATRTSLGQSPNRKLNTQIALEDQTGEPVSAGIQLRENRRRVKKCLEKVVSSSDSENANGNNVTVNVEKEKDNADSITRFPSPGVKSTRYSIKNGISDIGKKDTVVDSSLKQNDDMRNVEKDVRRKDSSLNKKSNETCGSILRKKIPNSADTSRVNKAISWNDKLREKKRAETTEKDMLLNDVSKRNKTNNVRKVTKSYLMSLCKVSNLDSNVEESAELAERDLFSEEESEHIDANRFSQSTADIKTKERKKRGKEIIDLVGVKKTIKSSLPITKKVQRRSIANGDVIDTPCVRKSNKDTLGDTIRMKNTNRDSSSSSTRAKVDERNSHLRRSSKPNKNSDSPMKKIRTSSTDESRSELNSVPDKRSADGRLRNKDKRIGARVNASAKHEKTTTIKYATSAAEKIYRTCSRSTTSRKSKKCNSIIEGSRRYRIISTRTGSSAKDLFHCDRCAFRCESRFYFMRHDCGRRLNCVVLLKKEVVCSVCYNDVLPNLGKHVCRPFKRPSYVGNIKQEPEELDEIKTEPWDDPTKMYSEHSSGIGSSVSSFSSPSISPAFSDQSSVAPDKITCSICDETFTVVNHFEFHMEKKHRDINDLNSMTLCTACDTKFSKPRYLYHHRCNSMIAHGLTSTNAHSFSANSLNQINESQDFSFCPNLNFQNEMSDYVPEMYTISDTAAETNQMSSFTRTEQPILLQIGKVYGGYKTYSATVSTNEYELETEGQSETQQQSQLENNPDVHLQSGVVGQPETHHQSQVTGIQLQSNILHSQEVNTETNSSQIDDTNIPDAWAAPKNSAMQVEYVCRYCFHRSTGNYEEFLIHLRQHNVSETRIKYLCTYGECFQSFFNETDLIGHLQICKKKESVKSKKY